MPQELNIFSLAMRRRPTGRQRHCLRIGIILAAYLACSITASFAQKPAESSLMKQLHQALGMAEHGDGRQALELTNQLLEQHPNFVPALKLQGMLLEETRQRAEAAQSYQKGLKL